MKAVPLSKGAVALVDAEDYDAVISAGKWQAVDCSGRIYARRTWTDSTQGTPGVQCTVSMHTFLTGWELVDHINGLSLDNRRANLRPATASQNSANRGLNEAGTRSGFKGVYWHAHSKSWQARIVKDRRARSLRYHPTAEQAARAYDRAAIELFGEYARTNFPREDYQ